MIMIDIILIDIDYLRLFVYQIIKFIDYFFLIFKNFANKINLMANFSNVININPTIYFNLYLNMIIKLETNFNFTLLLTYFCFIILETNLIFDFFNYFNMISFIILMINFEFINYF